MARVIEEALNVVEIKNRMENLVMTSKTVRMPGRKVVVNCGRENL